MRVFAAAGLVACAIAGLAAAAASAASFNGPRVEVLGGYDPFDTEVPGLQDDDGLLYGAGVGYDVQHGRLLFGVEADVTDSTAKVTGRFIRIHSDRDLYAGGRIGAMIGRGTALYAKLGYTNARLESNLGNGNLDGVRVGGGIEQALGSHLFVKGEYRYSNYEAELTRQQVLGGIGYRF